MPRNDRNLIKSMSQASGALLILSVILGFVMIPLSIVLDSGFSRYLLPILIFDSCSLLSVCGIIFAIYRTNASSTSIDLSEKSGPGFLLLVVALVLRLLCNPALFIVVALLCLSLFLCALWCVLACVGASTPDYVEYVVYRPVGYFYY
jgi:hypothetical protein